MNNTTWGDNKATSYYETVAGGSGAVCDFDCLKLRYIMFFDRDLIGMDDQVFIPI
jgi:hypothetical protein